MYLSDDALLKKPLIIDTHAHFDDDKFKGFAPSLFDELKNNGVNAIINNSVDLEDSAEYILNLSNNYDLFYSAIGVHPQTVDENFVFDGEKLKELITKNKKVVAIGEIGLDYYWTDEFKTEQKRIFKQQLEIANNLKMPVIIHDRDAHADTLEIIKEFKPTGTVHCFSGSNEMAKELLKLGLFIGVGGVVTFKNAKKLVEVVQSTPLERILLETDAPYLAPEPYRGKINLSSYLIFVAQKIAEIKNISTEKVIEITTQNAKTLYKI